MSQRINVRVFTLKNAPAEHNKVFRSKRKAREWLEDLGVEDDDTVREYKLAGEWFIDLLTADALKD